MTGPRSTSHQPTQPADQESASATTSGPATPTSTSPSSGPATTGDPIKSASTGSTGGPNSNSPQSDGPQSGGEPVNLSWLMPIGLINLSFWNFLARISTVGIYNFWGKTEVRRRLWSGIRVNGEPLVYTGRGMELFLGFLIVFFLILLPLILIPVGIMLYFGPESIYTKITQLVLYAVFFFLFGVAVYRAQRYRLSRTTWRGIRGQLVGNPWNYAWTSFWTGLLAIPTLGWILPWRAVRLQRYVTDDMRFGDRKFSFEGSSKPLYWRFAVLWFSSVVIYSAVVGVLGYSAITSEIDFQELAKQSEGGGQPTNDLIKFVLMIYAALIFAWLLYSIASAWYRARMFNHFAKCTKFENLNFNSTVQARGLIYIAVTNFFIRLSGSLVFLVAGLALAAWAFAVLSGIEPSGDPLQWDKTVKGITGIIGILALAFGLAGFGLFAPVTEARRSGYLIDNISISGTAPLAEIAQGSRQDIQTGEGLAEAFDIDAF